MTCLVRPAALCFFLLPLIQLTPPPAFKSHSHLFKLSLGHAIAQSTKLSIYEAVMQESLALTSSFPKELSTTGHLELNRRDALKMTGRLFKLRMDVNLIGGILGAPRIISPSGIV